MTHTKILFVGFCLWWLGINSCLYFSEFRFIQNFTGIHRKRAVVPYVLLSDLLTLLMMYCQSSGILRLLLHTGILFCFSLLILGIKWTDAVAPATIVLTLFTFMEGFQTILMRWLSKCQMNSFTAVSIQLLVSGILVILLIITLNFISRAYADRGQQKASSYLYSLLFPCAFIVWVIRSGLGLDVWTRPAPAPNAFLGDPSNLWALAWVLGACIIFFIILRLVNRITVISMQETEQKRLEDQIKKQYIYLEEAKKRNEKYRMFQHDIDNHFLVLSGLLHERKYQEAEAYFENLCGASRELLLGLESGNPVIDILLKEKISYASSNGIKILWDVCLPPDTSVADMDLCIILANAMDNAIWACIREKIEQPEISVSVHRRHDFLIFEVKNPLPDTYQGFQYGTGLKNIKHTVEKYEGTMEITVDRNTFLLAILLCIKPSAHKEPPSAKAG
ncbi:ATP-binding protein [bacterium 1XD21-13]|nr:ATP-binding protein [bacterium 1XD21-13]